jgi:hypothetical protein
MLVPPSLLSACEIDFLYALPILLNSAYWKYLPVYTIYENTSKAVP